MSSDIYGRYPLADARSPFVCGLTGKSHTAAEVVAREKNMAKAIAKRLESTLEGSEWDRVITVFSLNTVRTSQPPYVALLTTYRLITCL